jgi:hypothetical protein
VSLSIPARWVAASLLALLGAWLVAPAAVPIYDGIGQADEPYRYVQRPANAPVPPTDKAPTEAKATLTVSNGLSAAGYSNSDERGPQISLYVPAGALKVASGATSIVVTAQPLAPKPPLPTDGTIVTNVYHLSALADGQEAELVGTGNHAATIQMRAPTGKQPGPVFEHRTATGWLKVPTIRAGIDIYQAQATALGDWALVQAKGTEGSGGGGGWGAGRVAVLSIGIALLALAVIIGLVRSARLRQVTE